MDSGFRILDSGFRFQISELVFFDLWIPDSGFRILDSGFRILDFWFPIPDSGFRFQILVSGFRVLGLPCLPPVLYSWHGVKFLQRSSIEGNAHQNIKCFSSEGAPQVTFNSFYTREATFTTRHAD